MTKSIRKKGHIGVRMVVCKYCGRQKEYWREPCEFNKKKN